MEENDKLKLNLIPKDEWKKHYAELWKTETTTEENTEGAEDDEIDENTEEISQEELQAVIKKAKNKTGPGLDNKPMELFKYGGDILKDNLLALLNHIWQSRQIPKDWEVGLVINVHKKSNGNNCGNYRGITLLSMASKLYANISRNKLNKYTEEILGEEECGFQTGRGCIDAIFMLNKILEKRKISTNLCSVHR
jgi:hypothetical protein